MIWLRYLLAELLVVSFSSICCGQTQSAPPVADSPPTTPPAAKAKAPKTEGKAKPAKPKVDPSNAFFQSKLVAKLKIEISEPELAKLKENQRTYVRCNLIEDGKVTYRSVGIKLKGAAGSFREFDDRPALTLNIDRFTKDQSFHGLDKLHLNNSVQDESYLNEFLCADLCRTMKIPAPRVTHARVWLNGRDVGLYVLKEGFDKTFLKRHFADAQGNLYDGGFLQDIDVDLEKDSGNGPDDRSDLRALREACTEVDPEVRWQRIVTLLDLDRFIDFMALELMTCHWDGYTLQKNNYRLYFDPLTKKAHFLPHGMDQMFGDAAAPILDRPGAIVSAAVMDNPVWRKRYRTRLQQLLPLFAPEDKLQALVNSQHARLLPVMQEIGEEQANAFTERINELKQRLADRAENLKEQVERPEPGPLEFNAEGFVDLANWYGTSETEDAVHEEVELEGGLLVYSIKCGPSGTCVASWRRKALLSQGRYEFQASAKTENIVAQADEKGSGVGLRISGANRTEIQAGTNDWKPLTYVFEITEPVSEVELVAEIRSTSGQVWFDKSSLRLKRLPEAVKATTGS
jgi:spore coat protein H